ncbi:MAG: nitroreductase [Planctomycetota bacterium]|nr:nitroreductase [Planctomycetota bacterium]
MSTTPTRQTDGSPVLSAPEAITNRRATRHFDPDQPLPDDTLRRILHLATLAPSGYNLQPWRFLVVRTAANREKLRQCAYGQPKIGQAPVVVIVLGYHNPHRTHLGPMVAEQVRRDAITPEIGKGMTAMATRAMENVPDPQVWATRSTMLAAATLMIAAESLGVSSAPMEGFETEKVKQAFGVPDDHSVCCLIALGFAASSQTFPGRFGLDDVCYQEHFGQPWTLGDV